MKAREDQDPEYRNITQGRWSQKILAKKLHRDAGVPEGPCGLVDIKTFQQ